MPKLLQIVVEGNTGSTGRLAEALGNYVMSHSWESYIAFGRFPRPSNSQLIKIGNRSDILLHGLYTRLFDKHAFGSRQATVKLVNTIKEINPDIIHLHHLHGYYINIEILFKFLKAFAKPVIWTFHDCWSITGHCAHFDFIGCQRWKAGCHSCPQLREYPASFLVDNSKNNYLLKKELFNAVQDLTIVNVSHWLNNVVLESFLAGKENKVIYNGINLEVFKISLDTKSVRLKYAIDDRFMILGVASPWGERKGLSDFIKLSQKVDSNTVIVLVGLSSNQIRKLPKNIIGLEKTENQQELSILYSAADVFINFSVEETFGLTTAESLACGTPAIVYNSTASPEIVDSKTGFVVEKQGFDQVLSAIKELRNNGKEHYRASCRKRAVDLFDHKFCLNSYFELYQLKMNLDAKKA